MPLKRPENHGPSVRPSAALRDLGVPGTVVRAFGGNANMHWLVREGDVELVLRRYGPWRTHASVEYELAVIDYLAPRWPVAAPVVPPVTIGAHSWAIFPRLNGRASHGSVLTWTPAAQRQQGRLVAALQEDLAGLTGLEQRDGFVRADEVFGPRSDGPTVREILSDASLIDPEVGKRLLAYADRAQERFDAVDATARTTQVIHGDLQPANTFYTGGKLTGLIDFDLAHRNHRVADFAYTWWGDDDDVIAGFEEISPLDDAEKELLAPILWASVLNGVRIGRLWPTRPGPKSPVGVLKVFEHRSSLHYW